jgi:hypothetical protein
LKSLLRKLDRHALSLQTAQLTRVRNYDEKYTIIVRHPRNAPSWTYVSQEIPVDTDFSAPPTEVEGTEVEGDDDVVEEGDE